MRLFRSIGEELLHIFLKTFILHYNPITGMHKLYETYATCWIYDKFFEITSTLLIEIIAEISWITLFVGDQRISCINMHCFAWIFCQEVWEGRQKDVSLSNSRFHFSLSFLVNISFRGRKSRNKNQDSGYNGTDQHVQNNNGRIINTVQHSLTHTDLQQCNTACTIII